MAELRQPNKSAGSLCPLLVTCHTSLAKNLLLLEQRASFVQRFPSHSSIYTSRVASPADLLDILLGKMLNNFQDLAPDFEYVFRDRHELGCFRLFDLPPELWIKICEFAVLPPTPLDITRAKQSKHQRELVKQPAITRVCKLLRQEALPLFYRNNKFEVFHWGRVACVRYWLKAIGSTNLKSMGQLEFHAKFSPEFWIEKFDEIEIPVKVEVAEDQSQATRIRNFQSMVVTFL